LHTRAPQRIVSNINGKTRTGGTLHASFALAKSYLAIFTEGP
jgi:hypothetical protein